MLGFALNPNFRVNGYIYVLYVVDRYHLLRFGDPNCGPNANDYNVATISRLTRYQTACPLQDKEGAVISTMDL